MAPIDLEGKIFGALSNSPNGDVSSDTVFYYHQKDDYIWGHYEGGAVKCGILIGKVLPERQLEFEYSHYDTDGRYRSGKCRTKITIQEDGLLTLHENWQWITGDKTKGTSKLIEIRTN